MQRRRFLELASLAASAPLGGQARRRPPNVVVILSDDQGWGDLSSNGNTNLSTPHIDSLARDGAVFDRFFVCPVCAPTRAEFLTGRYHPRGGVRGVSTGAERLDLSEHTIAQTFRASGYATGAFGKWHNGSQHPYHPNARGFDEFYGFASGHWGQYFDPELESNGRLVRGKGYIIDDLTSHAISFIEKNRAQPFFCYLPLNSPHSPMQVPDRFWNRFAGVTPRLRSTDPKLEDPGMTRAALAMCENIDWNTGRVLARLDELRLSRDTIVIYFSDNGPNSWRWNGGMKGRKGTLDEGGLRVPFLIRWPGRIRGGTRVDRIAGAIDLFPTLTSLARIPGKASLPLDGRDLSPLMLGGSQAQWPDRMLFSMHARKAAVRTQQFRLDPEGRLFDMNADPGQTRDIAAEKPGTAARLGHALDAWKAEMLPHAGEDKRPFTVGFAPYTLLPARDGVPHGGIVRSARPPNCSYFTRWTSLEDSMTWHIEAGTPGDYMAEIYYACPARETGSAIQLEFRGESVRAKIIEAHDPPVIGKEFDRVERAESFVKDFRPMRLGRIRLKKGEGMLTLRATAVSGRQVAEIRYVALTKV